MQRLFVYGTLAPGRANHGLLKQIPGNWKRATLRGALCEEGWGATMGYPAIVPSDDGGEVEGFVFSSTDLSRHWARLDDFEGDAYERVLVRVTVDGTDEVEAWVYSLARRER